MNDFLLNWAGSMGMIFLIWLFCAAMVDLTMTRRYSRLRTAALWAGGFLILVVLTSLVDMIYEACVFLIPSGYDFISFIADSLFVAVVGLGFIFVSWRIYRGTTSSKFFIASFILFIGLSICDLSFSIIHMIFPWDLYQLKFATCVLILIILTLGLILTNRFLIKTMQETNRDLRGDFRNVLFIPLAVYLIYAVISSLWNSQEGAVFFIPEITTRIIFIIMVILLYMQVFYGITKTIKHIHIDEEMLLAHDLQSSILPSPGRFENMPGVEIFASISESELVGGDFYDIIRIGDYHLAFVIADVSGKGISAALMMMRVKTMIKMSVRALFTQPGRMLTLVNREIMENNDTCRFVTVFLGLLNLKTGRFTYSCAGHNPPILCTCGTCDPLVCEKAPGLGIMDHTYIDHRTVLKRTDTLFMYTDGVTDAQNKNGEMYGMDRLLSIVQRSDSPETMINSVTEDMNIFTGASGQADDMTMLGVRYTGEE
ncbi:MAG: PP2C family protein-serine/threonine phosphatase [Methanocorpusculum sp.]|jgi:sigma-B regulation protein RsbU (phosphoserine phosphatase)|uniref:PP2C family protein-serine/threonine phosphatase n=1 Tax=Methanocorpusculum sp. TaxID=2058474 RepID=UPI002A446BC2|nr:PP2C family protein-serine/threonine phosphatase [Methanocorpusculum sp.]MDD2803022.1 PP2C family protein-serine/threonine phosphatase [Methanocorpusculum sp.]MDY3202216.1 PP2C family protein-serine/threonine phosphatase [Methanocorpusculum sp.]MEA5086437.1 PP2C family protein-serine/threonine phosphatase [Methanocorpusculum sp.]